MPFVLENYRWLQSDVCRIADYITLALMDVDDDLPVSLYRGVLDTYTDIWLETLRNHHATSMR